MIKTIILIMILMIIAAISPAQQAKSDLSKIMSIFNSDILQVEEEINYYSGYKEKNPVETEKAVIMKKGSKLFSESFKIVKIYNDKFQITADHKLQTISINKANGKTESGILPFDIDTLVALSAGCKYHDYGNNLACWLLTFNLSDFRHIEFVFDKTSYLLKKIVLYYLFKVESEPAAEPERPRIEIVFTKIQTGVKFKDDIFSESKFIHIKNGEVHLNEAYRNYDLINNLETNN